MIRKAISLATGSVKACLPTNAREILWRLRGMQDRGNAWRMLATIPPADLLLALRMYYSDPHVPPGQVAIRTRMLPRPVTLRTRTSDMAVFRQVFIENQYDRLPIHDPRVIIDAGANIGLASLFFLRKYPRARVIALEPDPENLVVAEENLRPYKDRCILVPGALWSSRARLAIKRVGHHWATQVVAEPVGGDIQAYALADLKTMFDLPAVDLFKVDIEGAETEVFATGGPPVLDGVRCCAIELHGDACRVAFTAAAGPHQFKYYEQGELTIAWRSAA